MRTVRRSERSTAASVKLDFRELRDLRPLVCLGPDERGELRRRVAARERAVLEEELSASRRLKLFNQRCLYSVDDLLGRTRRHHDSIPGAAIEASDAAFLDARQFGHGGETLA